MQPDNHIDHLGGLFVGQLNDEETALFNQAVKAGLAYRSYEGTSGFLGLAKVRLTPRLQSY